VSANAGENLKEKAKEQQHGGLLMQLAIRNRSSIAFFATLATLASIHSSSAQLLNRSGAAKQAAAKTNAAPAAAAAPAQDPNAPKLQPARIPASPGDPVAIVNNQIITRQQLADEAVARKGEEILDSLIARVLIDQALKAKNLTVTSEEVNEEIEKTAQKMAGLSREAWLRTLAKERNISPAQYARDIVYPTVALTKLAQSRVQVTQEEIDQAFESMYGDKLRIRVIMVDKLRAAQDAWEKLKANPAGFEKMAMEISIDQSRSIGGLYSEPVARFSYPRNISDAAFRQLVDGDPEDKDPSHKPKDGDISGPIQLTETTWVLLKREGLIPRKQVDKKDAAVRENLRQIVFDAKIKGAIAEVYGDIEKNSAIENRLSGRVKLANEEAQPEAQEGAAAARQASAARQPAADAAVRPTAAAAAAAAKKLNVPTPKGLDPSEVQRANNLRQAPAAPAAPR
jgi:foldase protein PrsA